MKRFMRYQSQWHKHTDNMSTSLYFLHYYYYYSAATKLRKSKIKSLYTVLSHCNLGSTLSKAAPRPAPPLPAEGLASFLVVFDGGLLGVISSCVRHCEATILKLYFFILCNPKPKRNILCSGHMHSRSQQ